MCVCVCVCMYGAVRIKANCNLTSPPVSYDGYSILYLVATGKTILLMEEKHVNYCLLFLKQNSA